MGHAIVFTDLCTDLVPIVTITGTVSLMGMIMAKSCFEVSKGVFVMARGISILTIVCLSVLFGMGVISYAGSGKNAAFMQQHIEEVKRTKPKEYQAMVERAGGTITDCSSCHKEVRVMQRKK